MEVDTSGRCSRCSEEQSDSRLRAGWRLVPVEGKRRLAAAVPAVAGAGAGWAISGLLGALVGMFLAGCLGEIGGLMRWGVAPATAPSRARKRG